MSADAPLPASPDPRDRELRAALTAPLFTLDDHGPYLRVTTPFTLPDGDRLFLFVLRHSDPPLVADLGETLRWLRSHSSEPLRSARQQQQIVDACAGLGVTLERGSLRAHPGPDEPLPATLVRLVQACLRVADLRRTGRPRITRSFPDEVESYLRATLPAPLAITPNDRIPGISATTWSVDFRLRTPERHLLLFLLANERRDQARKLAEHVVAACTDLNHLRKLRRMPVQFITIFDDRGAAWNDADARLVAPFATPHRWSERASWVPALADPELSPDLTDEDDPDDPSPIDAPPDEHNTPPSPDSMPPEDAAPYPEEEHEPDDPDEPNDLPTPAAHADVPIDAPAHPDEPDSPAPRSPLTAPTQPDEPDSPTSLVPLDAPPHPDEPDSPTSLAPIDAPPHSDEPNNPTSFEPLDAPTHPDSPASRSPIDTLVTLHELDVPAFLSPLDTSTTSHPDSPTLSSPLDASPSHLDEPDSPILSSPLDASPSQPDRPTPPAPADAPATQLEPDDADLSAEYDVEPSLWGLPAELAVEPAVAQPIPTSPPPAPTREPPMNLHMRPATVADYPVFARLFPELGTGDPVPDEAAWAAHLHEGTLLLMQGDDTVAYVYYERMAEFGYVRNVVVDPGHRGRGVGRSLMQRLAAHLRGLGCTRWCLNVAPENKPAVALYRSLGLDIAYRSAAIRFDWSIVDAMPAEDVLLTTGPVDPREDDIIESDHDLPAGQLAAIRDDPSRVLLRLHDPEHPDALGLGFASFNPHFPGAFPFRVARPGLARPLLLGLRPHALPDTPQMHVVVEDDEPLRALLLSAGGELRLELLFLRGDLP